MPALSPQMNNLRIVTCDAVQRLLDSATFPNEKKALHHIYNVSRQKKKPCGFDLPSFESAYQAYRNYKRRSEYRSHQSSAKDTHLHTLTHDEFDADGYFA